MSHGSVRRVEIPEFRLDDRLTTEHLDYFDAYGFIRLRGFAPRAQALALYAAFDALTNDLVARRETHVNGVPLLRGRRSDGSLFFGRIPYVSLHRPEFRDFLRDARLQAIIEQLAPGGRLAETERDGLVVSRYRNDPGSSLPCLGWHTDSLREIAYGKVPRRYINIGFSLSDSPTRVGGLRVLPFTHRQPVLSMLTRKMNFFDVDADPDEVAITTEAGDLTIHDSRIWHRAATAEVTGDDSERCVAYMPVMQGPTRSKTDSARSITQIIRAVNWLRRRRAVR